MKEARVVVAACAAVCVLLAWPGAAEEEKPARFYVYKDAGAPENHGYWTNYMPKPEEGLAAGGQMMALDLADTADPKSGASCMRVSVKFAPPNWCGVAAACKENYWGEEPSDRAYNLSKACASTSATTGSTMCGRSGTPNPPRTCRRPS